MSTYGCKNYVAHGGAETVIGGKLTLLAGATVDDQAGALSAGSYTLPAATESALGGVKAAANQAASDATTIAALKEDFNALLAALKTAGIVVADTPAG